MGANSSSLSELQSNEYLIKLASNEPITPNDPFWNQLLSYSLSIPVNSADHRLLEESTVGLLKNLAIYNCHTGNFGSLVRVFLARAAELKSNPQVEDNIFLWQIYNALYIIRNVCKYFVENLSEEVVIQQFEAKPQQKDGLAGGFEHKSPMVEELMNSLMEILVDVPVEACTYGLHLEALNVLLILLAIQMFQPCPAKSSILYTHLMTGKCAIHACVFMKTLVQNYMAQTKCPAFMIRTHAEHGVLYNFTASVASGLWSVMTLGMAPKTTKPHEELQNDALLAQQSLLLILVLANHCTNEKELHNPYRQALFSFTNSQDQTSSSSPTHAVAMFKVDFTKLYNTMCETLKDDQSTLLVYLLLHRNAAVKAFVLSRTNIDQLVMPLLKILYHAQDKNSHHIYMTLIILLILSEDDAFSKAVHEITIKTVSWFKERSILEISLGGLLVLVVIRTIQYNMTRMRDKYLHTNCLAALANMSAQFKDLHPYVTQRIISLFGLLQKKHQRLVEQIRLTAMENHVETASDGSEENAENNYLQDLAVLEEVTRMVLEIVNSCLCQSLHHNPNLVYTLLYQKDLFAPFRTHPTFQDIIQNIDVVINFFTQKLEQQGRSLSVQEVHEFIRQGIMQFRRDRLKKFPELKFKYVEEDQPEEFFIPYVWSLVCQSSNLFFNPNRIQLFTLQTEEEEEAPS